MSTKHSPNRIVQAFAVLFVCKQSNVGLPHKCWALLNECLVVTPDIEGRTFVEKNMLTKIYETEWVYCFPWLLCILTILNRCVEYATLFLTLKQSNMIFLNIKVSMNACLYVFFITYANKFPCIILLATTDQYFSISGVYRFTWSDIGCVNKIELLSFCYCLQWWRYAPNLNSSDSGLHHTISLMYVGARHIEFWITSHIVT